MSKFTNDLAINSSAMWKITVYEIEWLFESNKLLLLELDRNCSEIKNEEDINKIEDDVESLD